MHHREHSPRSMPLEASRPALSRPPREAHGLLQLQRQAGNQATAMLVQRATAKQIANAQKQADDDFEAGNSGQYFAGNFLTNHIEPADPEVEHAKGGKGVLESKATRGQGWKKMHERSNVEGGGTGWGQQQKTTGTNTLILDFGPQKRYLMRAVNTAQIDALAAPQQVYLHFTSDENFRAVTYGTKGNRQLEKGKARLGALHNPALNRYQIDHLAGVG